MFIIWQTNFYHLVMGKKMLHHILKSLAWSRIQLQNVISTIIVCGLQELPNIPNNLPIPFNPIIISVDVTR
jgi:hypothetical protein